MLSMAVIHERVATPSTWTVQAPQSAMPQPNFVPVIPSTSRNTHKSGVSPSTSTVRSRPLTLIVVAMGYLRACSRGSQCFERQRDALAAADAERDHAALETIAPHGMQE